MGIEARRLPRPEGHLQPDPRHRPRGLLRAGRRDLEPRVAARLRLAGRVPLDRLPATQPTDERPARRDGRATRRERRHQPPREPLLRNAPRAADAHAEPASAPAPAAETPDAHAQRLPRRRDARRRDARRRDARRRRSSTVERRPERRNAATADGRTLRWRPERRRAVRRRRATDDAAPNETPTHGPGAPSPRPSYDHEDTHGQEDSASPHPRGSADRAPASDAPPSPSTPTRAAASRGRAAPRRHGHP